MLFHISATNTGVSQWGLGLGLGLGFLQWRHPRKLQGNHPQPEQIRSQSRIALLLQVT